MLRVYTFEEFMDEFNPLQWEDFPGEEKEVRKIIEEVRLRGDKALRDFARRFDGVEIEDIVVSQEEIEEALQIVGEKFRLALKNIKERIASFHRRRTSESWMITGPCGEIVGQKVIPLEKVGLYIPGGSAPYPSTVLMTAVPAQVAGVAEIYICTPAGEGGKVNPYILAAAAEAGVTKVFRVGGPGAVAALAYGSETIPAVDKICGPGNLYVTLAKKLVFGKVGIDMLAGPSEVLIIAGDEADPSFVAADLLAQGEHGPNSGCYLVYFSKKKLQDISQELDSQLPSLPRQEIASQALLSNGHAILVETIEEAFTVANKVAPEHLQIHLDNPLEYLDKSKHAGALCLGQYTPATIGDYWAGPNHVLPTGGAARYASPLTVEDFQKKSSILSFSQEALTCAEEDTLLLAEVEGFTAHANSLLVRKGRQS